jgi:ketopantoate reductase
MADLVAARFAGYSGPPSFSSMAQDAAAGRRTEVAQIFGDLARRGRRLGVPTPQTDFVDDIISGIDLQPDRRPGHPPADPSVTGTARAASRGGTS